MARLDPPQDQGGGPLLSSLGEIDDPFRRTLGGGIPGSGRAAHPAHGVDASYLENDIQTMIDLCESEIDRTEVSVETGPVEDQKAQHLHPQPAFLM